MRHDGRVQNSHQVNYSAHQTRWFTLFYAEPEPYWGTHYPLPEAIKFGQRHYPGQQWAY